MRRAVVVLGLASLVGATAGSLRAQTPFDQLTRGMRAYQNLDYDSAAVFLRDALLRPGQPALDDSGRVRALVYLGATELFRGHRDTATAVFGRLLRLDPRYRIDQLTFPPEVSGLFQQVRLRSRVVGVAVPSVTQIAAAGDRVVMWLYASSYHPIDVELTRGEGGVIVRNLYLGDLGDSLEVLWDGRTATRELADSGSYVIRIDSRGNDGRVVRSVRVPLEVAQQRTDTLPLPPPPADSLFKPESTAPGNGRRPLATGVVAAVAVVALPLVVGGSGGGMPDRFALAGAFGLAAAVGFRLDHGPQPIPQNIAANQALRLSWERRVQAVRAENVVRRQQVRLVVRAGTPEVVESP
jgi:hypothetical protein